MDIVYKRAMECEIGIARRRLADETSLAEALMETDQPNRTPAVIFDLRIYTCRANLLYFLQVYNHEFPNLSSQIEIERLRQEMEPTKQPQEPTKA